MPSVMSHGQAQMGAFYEEYPCGEKKDKPQCVGSWQSRT